MNLDPVLKQRAAGTRGVVFDVDGVLTDGRIVYSSSGNELKQFHVQDGASIKLLLSRQIPVAIITGRNSVMVDRRAKELGVEYLVQGAASKADALRDLLAQGFPDRDLCVIGDDIQDLPLFAQAAVTLSIAVPNAHPAVLRRAHFVTQRAGGEGVAVEVAELILRAQDRWDFD